MRDRKILEWKKENISGVSGSEEERKPIFLIKSIRNMRDMRDNRDTRGNRKIYYVYHNNNNKFIYIDMKRPIYIGSLEYFGVSCKFFPVPGGGRGWDLDAENGDYSPKPTSTHQKR